MQLAFLNSTNKPATLAKPYTARDLFLYSDSFSLFLYFIYNTIAPTKAHVLSCAGNILQIIHSWLHEKIFDVE